MRINRERIQDLSCMRRLLVEHFPVALLVGLSSFGWTGNWLCIPVAFATGWLIDADHLFDFGYYVFRHYPNVNYRLMSNGGYFKINNKVFVPFHSWELTLLMLIGGIVAGETALGLVAATAHGAHIIQDQFHYRVRGLGYFLISRALSHFRLENFCVSS